MKALSVRQPWAWLIVNGYKDVENRPWTTGFRGRIYIHAGKTEATWETVCNGLDPQQIHALEGYVMGYPHALGALVGEVNIVSCVPKHASPWFQGPHGLVLANPVAYETPIPYKGRLGLFDVELPVSISPRNIHGIKDNAFDKENET